MPEYEYRARNTRGDLVVGRIEADTADAVANQLFSIGITPVYIDAIVEQQDVFEDIRRLLGGYRPTLDDLLLFSRQMYSLTKAGVPLVRGLRNLASSTRNPVFRDAIHDIVDTLESGRDLATALGQHPEIFPPLFISVIRVGESSGELEDSFLRMSEYLAREKDTRQQVKQALRYPVIVVVAIAVAVAIVTLFVIPAFADVFARAGVELPWATQVILAVSDFMVAAWPYLLGGLAAVVLLARWWVSTDTGRYRWDKAKLGFPVVGDIVTRAVLGRFARAFSISFSAGVPLIQALTLVAQAVDNAYLEEHVLGIRNGVERGDSLTRTAQASGLFTPLVIQMLSVGEETGAVDDMLLEVAEYYEREVEYDIRNLAALIEPILLVAVGAMVLVLALGIFLPMWDLAQVAR